MLPLQMAEREGWFDGYDWVIRLNPDVIIRSDAHLLPLFARSNVDAVFASCPTRMAPALRLRVHRTTRHAWRRLDSGFVSAIKFYRVRMGLSVRSDVAGRGGGGSLAFKYP